MKSWWSAHGGNEIQIIRDGWVSSSTSFLLVFLILCRLYWRSTDGILNAMYLFFNVITLIKLNHPRVIWDEFAIILTRLITSSSFHFSSPIFSLSPEMRNLMTTSNTAQLEGEIDPLKCSPFLVLGPRWNCILMISRLNFYLKYNFFLHCFLWSHKFVRDIKSNKTKHTR